MLTSGARVSNAWSYLPISEEQPGEIQANTAYDLRVKAGDSFGNLALMDGSASD